MDKKDCYYEILGLEPGASPEEVKQAYLDLAKVWHPDRFPSDPRLQQKAQEKLKEINIAYEQLRSFRSDSGTGNDEPASPSQPSTSDSSSTQASAPEISLRFPHRTVRADKVTSARRARIWLAVLILLIMLPLIFSQLNGPHKPSTSAPEEDPVGTIWSPKSYSENPGIRGHSEEETRPKGLATQPLSADYGGRSGKIQSLSTPIDRLSPGERIRFNEILTGVIQDPEYMASKVHDEFWVLLNKMGPLSPAEAQKLREIMTGVATTYQRYFWEDALWALKTGRPFKSLQRERYEKHLLNLGVLTEGRIKENETLTAKIAFKEPTPYQGTTVVFNEQIINKALANLGAVRKRVDDLFANTTVPSR